MLHKNKLNYHKLIVTTDLFRVDDRNEGQCINSQRKMCEWINALLAPLVSGALGLSEVELLHGDEGGYDSIRWKVFSRAGLPFHYESWAMLYQGENYSELLDEELAQAFDGSVVLSFEACPAMIDFFNRHEIPYVDCSIHPVRFLPDYFLGFRTNVDEWCHRLRANMISEDIISDFARISAGRTMMTFPQKKAETLCDGSVIFFGQMDVDASLIHQGRMADQEQIEEALIELSAAYPKVYYKRHPHNNNAKSLEKIVKRIRGCEWLDINAYDSMALSQFELVSTLSSGTAYEARYFGKKAKTFLGQESWFDVEREDKRYAYHGIYESYLGQAFWNCILADFSEDFSPVVPSPYEGGLKFNLNKKWGR